MVEEIGIGKTNFRPATDGKNNIIRRKIDFISFLVSKDSFKQDEEGIIFDLL